MNAPTPLRLSTAPEDYEGALAVAMRRLYTKLRPRIWREQMQSVAITSAVSGEGRSTIAANLAITIARHKRTETLLVDADARRPVLHSMMELSRGKGFSDVLRNESRPEDVLRQTPFQNLRLVTCGTLVDRPGAIFRPDALQRAVAAFTERFDLVLFDVSPLLLGQEAVALSNMVDGVLLVVLRSRTRRSEVRQALRALATAERARTLGLVLNNAAAPQRRREFTSAD